MVFVQPADLAVGILEPLGRQLQEQTVHEELVALRRSGGRR
jgi:hypothetical protein